MVQKVLDLIQNAKESTSIEIIKGQQLVQKGMNLHYEVGKGADFEPHYVAVKYIGNPESD